MALREGALGSLRLLLVDHEDPRVAARRAVLVADVAADAVKQRRTSTTRWCGCRRPCAVDDLLAVYVDIAAAEADVRTAIAVIDEADLGDGTPNWPSGTPRTTIWRGARHPGTPVFA